MFFFMTKHYFGSCILHNYFLELRYYRYVGVYKVIKDIKCIKQGEKKRGKKEKKRGKKEKTKKKGERGTIGTW